MGFLERAIRRGISEGIGKAVGNAINQAIEPKASELINRAANQLDNAAGNTQARNESYSDVQTAFSGFEKAAQSFVTKQAENLKICSHCGESAAASQKFCQSCGSALPELTVAETSKCPSCGKQNNIGTKFCTDCGTKLPSAVMEEEAHRRELAEISAQWQEKLPQYPEWSFGGENLYIDEYDGYIVFGADFRNNAGAARNAFEQYRSMAKQNGFRPAGQYPTDDHLYKMTGSVCYHIDFEHSFESGSCQVSLGFMTGEPTGGFNYVKPEPQKPIGLRDIFKF